MGYFSNIYTFLEKSRPIEKAANALKGNCPGYTKKNSKHAMKQALKMGKLRASEGCLFLPQWQ